MEAVTAIVSLLHQPPAPTSATRMFRGRSVLAWTLRRLRLCSEAGQTAVLCWEDQLPDVRPVALEAGAHVLAKGPRTRLPLVEAIAAARRWADGWRGGLLAATCFDNGFYGPWMLEILQCMPAEAVLLVDPDAALVDGHLLSGLVAHARAHADTEYVFSPAAPGLSGMLLRAGLLRAFAEQGGYPGQLLNYHPDVLGRDPVSTDACAPVPRGVARTTQRFLLDSRRQIRRMEKATASLDGALADTGAEELVRRMHACAGDCDELPRDVVIQPCARRLSSPVFAAKHDAGRDRDSLDAGILQQVLAELAAEEDDLRLTLGGAGDPLLAEDAPRIIEAAAQTGVQAIHVETDLLNEDPAVIDRLADLPVDVVSVHIPATTAETYARVMGVDGFARVMANVQRLIDRRHADGRLVPLIAPLFVKCRQNLHEMEDWYDQWLRKLGSAVIRGPGGCDGPGDDVEAADMRPPRRVACRQLGRSLAILSDGRVVCCEEDVLGRQSAGRAGEAPLHRLWREAASRLRRDHDAGLWDRHPACAGCRQWHR